MKKNIAGICLTFLILTFGMPVLPVSGGQEASVVLQQTGLSVTGGLGAVTLSLRIVGPDGSVVCDLSSDGGPLSWSASGMPDGQYSYEVRQGVVPRRVRSEQQAGGLGEPAAPASISSGGFFLQGGSLILQEREGVGIFQSISSGVSRALASVGDFLVTPVYADVVHADDVIITGSECVGFDCLTDGTESFGFDTLRLKENNLQIHFEDTSATAGFPANDWRILINSSASGGTSYFSVEDSTAATRPFTIEAGSATNSLYVKGSRVGLGTSLPVLKLHLVQGDTPALRLDQDTSSGWTAQVWDVAGNESNFFVRDTTGGSQLPFRIQPGTPTNTVTLKNSGFVGIGTWAPEHTLHVVGDALITGNLELGSSRSLKKDIRFLDTIDASAALAALEPVRFHYKTSPDEESLGFIAEDVPDLVATKSRKTLSTMDVVAVLTKVVQDQQATIARLENSVNQLEKKVSRQ
ncbi:MAG: tail fiber domain-containing protein, partial [Desulfocapsaceae bacterium]|nr:tail fiber domain-containing protein [Desulfocapsaceae bacterium]